MNNTQKEKTERIVIGVLAILCILLHNISHDRIKDWLKQREWFHEYASELPIKIDTAFSIQKCSINKKGLCIYVLSTDVSNIETLDEKRAAHCYFYLSQYDSDAVDQCLAFLKRRNKSISIIIHDSSNRVLREYHYLSLTDAWEIENLYKECYKEFSFSIPEEWRERHRDKNSLRYHLYNDVKIY